MAVAVGAALKQNATMWPLCLASSLSAAPLSCSYQLVQRTVLWGATLPLLCCAPSQSSNVHLACVPSRSLPAALNQLAVLLEGLTPALFLTQVHF